jgi:hypothetical protein
MCGRNITVDSQIRIERLRYYPKADYLRQLWMQVQITEWLMLYPEPPKDTVEWHSWKSASQFTEEELTLGMDSIELFVCKPIDAHAILHHGVDMLPSALPGPEVHIDRKWVILCTGAEPTEGVDAQRIIRAAGVSMDSIMSATPPKLSMVGAVLLSGQDSAVEDQAPSSKWDTSNNSPVALYTPINPVHGRILAAIAWKFNQSGPTPLFRDINIDINGRSTLCSQSDSYQRLTAIRKKLLKFKLRIVQDCIGQRHVAGKKHEPRRRRVRKRRRGDAEIHREAQATDEKRSRSR